MTIYTNWIFSIRNINLQFAVYLCKDWGWVLIYRVWLLNHKLGFMFLVFLSGVALPNNPLQSILWYISLNCIILLFYSITVNYIDFLSWLCTVFCSIPHSKYLSYSLHASLPFVVTIINRYPTLRYSFAILTSNFLHFGKPPNHFTQKSLYLLKASNWSYWFWQTIHIFGHTASCPSLPLVAFHFWTLDCNSKHFKPIHWSWHQYSLVGPLEERNGQRFTDFYPILSIPSWSRRRRDPPRIRRRVLVRSSLPMATEK